jgi:hypothetical protein
MGWESLRISDASRYRRFLERWVCCHPGTAFVATFAVSVTLSSFRTMESLISYSLNPFAANEGNLQAGL